MRPALMHVDTVLRWVLNTFDPDKAGVLKDADSAPTVAVRKNGTGVGDSVTVTKRSATTGIYDCSYDPASEVESDQFTLEESATITGSTTASASYRNSWSVRVVAVERGTNGANTVAPATPANVSDVQTAVLAKLPATLVGGRMDSSVGAIAADAITNAAFQDGAISATKIASNALTAAKFAAGAFDAVWSVSSRTITGDVTVSAASQAAIVAAIEVEILNDGTGGAVIQTIADAVAGYFDSATLDLPPQIIAAAVRTNLATELARIDVATSTRSSQTSVDTIDDFVDTEISTLLSRLDVTLSTALASTASTVQGTQASNSQTGAAAALDAISVTALARFATVNTGQATAATQSVAKLAQGAGGGSLTSEQAAQLDAIEAACGQITGARLSVVGPVTPGGDIALIIGTDYVSAAQNGLTRTITDVGGLLHARLTSATLAAIKRFGAGRGREANQIVGTISSVNYTANVTSISIEIDRADIPSTLVAADDYQYQIERETSGGDKVVEVTGDLSVDIRRV